MSNDLKYYNAAYKDVKIDSTPSRYNDGIYKWSNGQEEILTESQFNELRNQQTEISNLETKKETLIKEMLMYQNPVNYLEKEGGGLVKVRQTEIDDEQLNLNVLKTELKQFDDAMFNRGHFVEDEEQEEEKPATETNTNKKPGIINLAVKFRNKLVYLPYGKGRFQDIVRGLIAGFQETSDAAY